MRLTWHGPATFSREERLAMTALSEALDIRLREILREDMGGTYGVGVGGGLWKDPQPGYAFDVSFGCAPENVDGMIQAVMDEFARVQREGVSEEIVKKVHEQLVREREVALERNGFWASSILFLRQIDEDVASIASYRQLLTRSTAR
ncbi:MAG: insulinase family protein [Acidobacteria bacterium]|nr:insulinase family protein [Acidobacteriota bacterium]